MHSAQTCATKTLEDAVSDFIAIRPRLSLIAYRILGSAAEAEDVVQEAWLRWQNTDRSQVLNPAAFLSRTTARLALNVVQSARSRHEVSAGPWLAETIDTGADPVTRAERADALDQALGLLLEKLNPTERAAYVLRVAFDYPYSKIADNLRLSQGNTRQIVSRARKRLDREGRGQVSTAEHRRFRGAFVDAAQSGNLTGLESLLTVDTRRDRVRAA
jgi:RNA polymerase sigma-70 factor (ECF subfamily)